MSDPDSEVEAAERWLDQLDPDDPTVRAYNVEAVSAAVNQLHDAVAAALADGVPARIIQVNVDDLDDRLSVLLRTGETIPADELWADLGIREDVEDS